MSGVNVEMAVENATTSAFYRFGGTGQLDQAVKEAAASAFLMFMQNGGMGEAVKEGLTGENIREAWSGFRLIRETLETLGPVGAVEGEERIITFTQEAEVLCAAIRKLADERSK